MAVKTPKSDSVVVQLCATRVRSASSPIESRRLPQLPQHEQLLEGVSHNHSRPERCLLSVVAPGAALGVGAGSAAFDVDDGRGIFFCGSCAALEIGGDAD